MDFILEKEGVYSLVSRKSCKFSSYSCQAPKIPRLGQNLIKISHFVEVDSFPASPETPIGIE